MRRLFVGLIGFAVVVGVIGGESASAQQSVNLFLGGFKPTSLDARSSGDVLVANSAFLTTVRGFDNFDINQFNGVTLGGEWLVDLGRHAEAGLGVGFYQRTVSA